MTKNEFLELKEQTIKDMNLYNALLSDLDPPPLEYIEKINDFQVQIEISNKAEFETLHPLWLEIIGDTLEVWRGNNEAETEEKSE